MDVVIKVRRRVVRAGKICISMTHVVLPRALLHSSRHSQSYVFYFLLYIHVYLSLLFVCRLGRMISLTQSAMSEIRRQVSDSDLPLSTTL